MTDCHADVLTTKIGAELNASAAALREARTRLRTAEIMVCLAKVASMDKLPDRLVFAVLTMSRPELAKLTTRSCAILQTWDQFHQRSQQPMIVYVTDGRLERTMVADLASFGAA